MELTATAPCPTADATRLTTPWLTSPAAEMPDTLASIKNESCVSFQFFGWRPSRIKRRNKLKSQIGFGYFNQGYRKIERHFGSNRTHGISVTSCYAIPFLNFINSCIIPYEYWISISSRKFSFIESIGETGILARYRGLRLSASAVLNVTKFLGWRKKYTLIRSGYRVTVGILSTVEPAE